MAKGTLNAIGQLCVATIKNGRKQVVQQRHHICWYTLRLMAAEASDLRPGGETVITRLADILVIQAIRSWMAEDPTAQNGWLGALQDRQIGRSILLIHRNPEHKWTVKSLAARVAMSRSAYAARFKEIVGESPMHYVARWRMNVAQMWIKEENLSFDEIASRLGYTSEAAFSRAFKRIIGVSPGVARRTGDKLQGNVGLTTLTT